MVKIVATRCHIFRLKCTKFDFGGGSAYRPLWGNARIQQSPRHPSCIYGVLFLRGGRRGDEKGGGRIRGERKGKA